MSTAGIFTVDRELTVRSWNDWMAAATGRSEADVVGRALAELVPDFEARGWRARFVKVLETGAPAVLSAALHKYLIPCPPLAPSNTFDRMQQRVSLGPWAAAGAVPLLGVVVTIEDVTARLDRERELAAALSDPDQARAVLGGADWRARRDAVDQFAAVASEDTLASVVRAVQRDHRDISVLSSALQLLSRSEADMTSHLASLLRDPDPDLRLQAALALGQQQRASAEAPLIAALDDADVNVRFHAIEALGHMRARGAVDRLLDLAESGDFFLAFPAIDALTRIGDRTAGSRLAPLLAVDLLRPAVAAALGALGDARAIAPLVRLLNENAAVAAAAAGALESVCQRDAELFGSDTSLADEIGASISSTGIAHLASAMETASDAERRTLVRVAAWSRTVESDALLLSCLGDAATGREAVGLLAQRGARVVDALITALSSDSPDRRRDAVIALGRLGDRRATAALLDLANREDTLLVPITAAFARSADPAAFEWLLSLLAAPSGAVRQGAIAALNSMGHPDLEPRIAALLDHENPIVRESAVRVAGYFGFRSCAAALLARCSDPALPVRKAAIEHAAFLDDPRAAGMLAQALQRDVPPIRAAAAQALGRMDDDAALLLEAMRDDDAWVRYYAARSLASRRETSAADVLSRAATDDPATPVRIAAIEALPDVEGARGLLSIARVLDDPDPEVACAIVSAASRTGAPEVFPIVERALRHANPGVRQAAAEGLRRFGGPRAIELLQLAAGAEDDRATVTAAIDSLAVLAQTDAAAVRALLLLLAEPALEADVVSALGTLPARAVPDISQALSHPAVHVRLGAVAALARLRDAAASATLQAALDDEAAAVRENAVVALMRLGHTGAIDRIRRLAEADSSRAVRAAAAAALASLRTDR